MKFPNILADQMTLFPSIPKALRIITAGKAESGQIVDQGVDPHVDDLARIAGKQNSPSLRPRGIARNRNVDQASLDELENLALPGLGSDPNTARGDELSHRFLVGTEPEERVFLGDFDGRDEVFGTDTVVQVVREVEVLAAGAVESEIILAIDVVRAKTLE